MKQAVIKNKVVRDKRTFYNSLIPSDWEMSTVGEAFEICNNLRLPISEEERKKGNKRQVYTVQANTWEKIEEARKGK